MSIFKHLVLLLLFVAAQVPAAEVSRGIPDIHKVEKKKERKTEKKKTTRSKKKVKLFPEDTPPTGFLVVGANVIAILGLLMGIVLLIEPNIYDPSFVTDMAIAMTLGAIGMGYGIRVLWRKNITKKQKKWAIVAIVVGGIAVISPVVGLLIAV